MRNNKFNEKEIILLRQIGCYFNDYVDKLKILDVEFNEEENKFYILLSRPGLLIGYKGNDINKIMNNVKEELNDPNVTFHVSESKIDNHLHIYECINYYT